jgi:hypothetical protein
VRTEDLIKTLAVDHTMDIAPARMLALAVLAGAVIATLVFAEMLGVRPDVDEAMHTVRFPFKFVVTITLAIAGLALVSRLERPGADWRAAARLLIIPALLIGAAVVLEMIVVPPSGWEPRMVGSNAMICLTAIPTIAVAPLAAILIAMRHAAPTAPVRAGAAAGLAAAAVAATLYASHCTDDSPLFVVIWYSIAIALVTAAGALLGSRLLRW